MNQPYIDDKYSPGRSQAFFWYLSVECLLYARYCSLCISYISGQNKTKSTSSTVCSNCGPKMHSQPSWSKKGQPTAVFLSGKSYGQRSLVGYNPWGHKELDTLSIYVEKEIAAHSSILAWRILWTEELGGLQPMGSHRVGHD